MKRILILAVILVSVTTIGLLLPGSETDAAGCIRCLPGGTTPPAWGFGSTCGAATNDAINQASALIPCDSCQETTVGVAPCDTSCSNVGTCYTPYGQWRVDVKIQYRCNENLCL